MCLFSAVLHPKRVKLHWRSLKTRLPLQSLLYRALCWQGIFGPHIVCWLGSVSTDKGNFDTCRKRFLTRENNPPSWLHFCLFSCQRNPRWSDKGKSSTAHCQLLRICNLPSLVLSSRRRKSYVGVTDDRLRHWSQDQLCQKSGLWSRIIKSKWALRCRELNSYTL